MKIVEGAIGPHVAGDAEHIARNIVAQQACDIASAILKRARYVARQNGETVAFNLMP